LGCLEELKLNFVVAIEGIMECGCLKDKRFGAIDGENLTGFLVIKLKKCVCKRNHFGKKRNVDFGRLRQTRNNARKFNLVCDDRDSGLNYKDVGIYMAVEI